MKGKERNLTVANLLFTETTQTAVRHGWRSLGGSYTFQVLSQSFLWFPRCAGSKIAHFHCVGHWLTQQLVLSCKPLSLRAGAPLQCYVDLIIGTILVTGEDRRIDTVSNTWRVIRHEPSRSDIRIDQMCSAASSPILSFERRCRHVRRLLIRDVFP